MWCRSWTPCQHHTSAMSVFGPRIGQFLGEVHGLPQKKKTESSARPMIEIKVHQSDCTYPLNLVTMNWWNLSPNMAIYLSPLHQIIIALHGFVTPVDGRTKQLRKNQLGMLCSQGSQVAYHLRQRSSRRSKAFLTYYIGHCFPVHSLRDLFNLIIFGNEFMLVLTSFSLTLQISATRWINVLPSFSMPSRM